MLGFSEKKKNCLCSPTENHCSEAKHTENSGKIYKSNALDKCLYEQ